MTQIVMNLKARAQQFNEFTSDGDCSKYSFEKRPFLVMVQLLKSHKLIHLRKTLTFLLLFVAIDLFRPDCDTTRFDPSYEDKRPGFPSLIRRNMSSANSPDLPAIPRAFNGIEFGWKCIFGRCATWLRGRLPGGYLLHPAGKHHNSVFPPFVLPDYDHATLEINVFQP